MNVLAWILVHVGPSLRRSRPGRREIPDGGCPAGRNADRYSATAELIETDILVNVALGIGVAVEIWPCLARRDRP